MMEPPKNGLSEPTDEAEGVSGTGATKEPMARVLLCLPKGLLEATDQEARLNYMSRSDLMRRALLWYLRPAAKARRHDGHTEEEETEELYTDPGELLKILQHQKARASIRAMLREQKKHRQKERSQKADRNG